MTTEYEVTFWEAGGHRELTEVYKCETIGEALQMGRAEIEVARREHGFVWEMVAICEDRYNSEEAFDKIAWLPAEI
jgi:hypothetical protein